MSDQCPPAPRDWRVLGREAERLQEYARAGDWPAVARRHESLSASLGVVTATDGEDAAVAAAAIVDALRETARLAEAARDSVAAKLLELRAGSRAVAAYSDGVTAPHHRG